MTASTYAYVPTLEERFWSKVDKSRDCWIWTAARTYFYGVIWVNGRNELAHRQSWIMENGATLIGEILTISRQSVNDIVSGRTWKNKGG